jgi:rSAM/selenodomain-associated transferase 1
VIKGHLFIMVKEPRAGRVKTRLGRDIGMTAAAWWFRHQATKLIRSLSRDPRWKTVLAVAPDVDGLTSRIWPNALDRWPQGRGDLGDRMGNIMHHGPSGPVVIIGADIPNITPKLINDAFTALGSHDAVVGPAPDGGFWLIGLKRGATPVPKTLFKNVRWSHEQTLNDTLKTLNTLSVKRIATLQDVDTVGDLPKR